MIKNPNIDVIGHPGDPRFPIDIKAVAAAKEYGTLLEINNNSLIPIVLGLVEQISSRK